jgi:hypothetical protein
MTALTYTDVLTQVANLVPTNTTDSNFLIMFPSAVNDAEMRLYRDLDLLNTQATGTTTLSTGQRSFALPDTFVVLDELNVITPAGTTDPSAGARVALTPVTKELLDMLWPSSVGSGVPSYFARLTDGTSLLGPWPNSAYTVEAVGTQRPASLSVSNVTTLLSTYFPDLLIAGLMIFVSAYMRDFSSSSDDPQSGVNWEQHYKALLQSALVEEQRKKFRAEGWSPSQPSPIATPARN